jgi:GNAT superfamily N-acetyltransferase
VYVIEVKDLGALRDFHAVEEPTYLHDYVALPVDPIEEFIPVIEGKQPPGEVVTYYVGYDGDTPVASMTVNMWTLDNLLSANVEARVHPSYRSRGFGRQLMQHAIDVVRSAGRNRIFIETHWQPDGSEGLGAPLLRSLGAKPVLDDYRRLLDFEAFPVGEPWPVPEGYRLVQWWDRAPDELVDGIAYLLHRMVLDAPMGQMDYEAEAWDEKRYRRSEESAIERGRTRFSTVVVHEESGEVAGLTEIGLNRSRPQIGYQWETIVDPRHRGKKLGMVLKSWNHKLVTEEVPDLRWLNTWNATSNSFMIAVNEALGFRIAEKWTEWQLDL